MSDSGSFFLLSWKKIRDAGNRKTQASKTLMLFIPSPVVGHLGCTTFISFFSIIDFTCEPERLRGLSTDKLLEEQGEKAISGCESVVDHRNAHYVRRRHIVRANEKSEI